MRNRDPLSRRLFLAQTSTSFLAATTSQLLFAAERPNAKPLRVIAYNVFHCTGWPKDRALANRATAAGQMPDRFANELSLYTPDVLNFSESPSEAVVERIAKKLGMNYVYFPSGGNWPGTILSRFEIVDSRNVPLTRGQRPKDLFTRHWGRATIKLPDGEKLIVHSAHLYPGPDPTIRLREIPLMLAAMQHDLKAGHSMLLIGDLNHSPDTTEYQHWMDAGWTDTFAKVGHGEGFSITADQPKARIDYVMAAGPIAKHVFESRPLFEGAFRLNTADPQAFSLSDHLPQLAVFGET